MRKAAGLLTRAGYFLGGMGAGEVVCHHEAVSVFMLAAFMLISAQLLRKEATKSEADSNNSDG